MKSSRWNLMTLVFVGVLAAMVYVTSTLRFQLLGSQVHFANAVCVLAGMLLGPAPGGMAAGLGSALYDAFTGRDVLTVAITFVSKFAMGFVCGLLMGRPGQRQGKIDRTTLAAAAGALTYVLLYMLKSFIFGAIAGNPWAPVISKLPASLLNAAAAVVAAPLFYHAVLPALKSSGILEQLRQDKAK